VGQADDGVAAPAPAASGRALNGLDDWLADPQVRTRHRRVARAGTDPDALWRAAESIRLRDTPMLGRAVRWRIPGTPAALAYGELFRGYPFTVLDESDRGLVSGLAGRIWTLKRDYPRLSGAEEFVAWDQPGTVRVAFAHWVEDGGDGPPAIVSESRVQAVDRRSAMRLRALWGVVGRFERLIGGEALRVAARRAERA
jgi:hypothetical protein